MLLGLFWQTPNTPPPAPPSPAPAPVSTVGTSDDFLARLKRLIPTRWFNVTAPIRDAILGGIADATAWSYSLFAFVKAQTRLATATGQFIDLFAFDYLGLTIRRRDGESDALFAPRVQKEILRPRVTRAAMIEALTDLTGRAPIIVEPWNTGDTGAWDVGTWAWEGVQLGAVNGGGWDTGELAWDTAGCFFVDGGELALSSDGAGCWGDLLLPQVLITVFPPFSQGFPNISGWDDPQSAWDSGSATEWVNQDDAAGGVSRDDVFAVINAAKPNGTSAWVQFALGWP